ncbi:Urease subunit alpha [Frankliniella fusca]|uniref:Urease subunit alpha n=1 Tax=Frankliniella fusca TaxID=407009 RepID=A0AAE1I1B8_9NEOP|nr:Urease subunit alpha [Frankliniella fusca]
MWWKKQLLKVKCNAASIWWMCIFGLLQHSTEPGAARKNINTIAGPFIAYGKTFYNCETDKTTWKWYIRATHFNPAKPHHLQRITGNVTGADTLDDTLWGQPICSQ